MADRDDLEAQLIERAQRDPEFRARLLRDPKAAIAEGLAVELPAVLTVRVVEEQPGEAVLVLPAPAPGEMIGEAELSSVAGGSGAGWCANNTLSHSPCNCPFSGPRGSCH